MNLLLTNLILWPFLALIAVPLLVHLFARSRPPVYRFSSVEFILRIVRNTMRVKRPQDWLLLLVRTLLYTAVILVFLQPLFFANRGLAGLFQRRNVVVIVDATASMACAEGAQSRFVSACAEASEVLAGLSSRDTANVIWLDSSPDAVYPALGSNVGYLQGALRRARVTSEAGNPEAALIMAARMLDGVEGKREICLISDFQEAAWKRASLAAPPGTDLLTVRVGQAPAANCALTDLFCEPPRALTGETVTVCCEIQNFSDQPRQTTVFLNAGQSRLSQDIHLLPWQKKTALFEHRSATRGLQPLSASLSEDPFPGDDHRWALLDVTDALHVGLLPLDQATAGIWQRALDALGWARIELVSRADLERDLPFDILLLAGWDGTAAASLQRKRAAGGSILCHPARDIQPSALRTLAGLPPPAALSSDPSLDAPLEWDRSVEPRRMRVTDSRDPLFRIFADGAHGDPSRGAFLARLRFPAARFETSRSLLTYDDGVPALLRLDPEGRVFLWNIPLDPEYTTWARQTEFLVLFGELILSMRTRSAPLDLRLSAEPGHSLSWELDREAIAGDMRLVDRDGHPILVRDRRADNRTTFLSAPVSAPGLYAWEFQDKRLGHAVVNFPPVESDLRLLSPPDIKRMGAGIVTRGIAVRQLRDGIELWPRLLALAIALAILESLLLLWVEQVRFRKGTASSSHPALKSP